MSAGLVGTYLRSVQGREKIATEFLMSASRLWGVFPELHVCCMTPMLVEYLASDTYSLPSALRI